MTYEQAITNAKNGQNVTRSSWSGRYIRRRIETDSEGNTKTYLEDVTTRTTIAPYTSSNSDIMATDWQAT
mgnify:CR=1 FL=1